MLYYKKHIQKIKLFLERDSDITYYEEFNYIFITIKETIKILLNIK